MTLAEKNIVLTHSGSISSFKSLEDASANLHHFPMLTIQPITTIPMFSLSDYDYYIFTSKNGVQAFFDLPFVKVQYEKKVNAISIGSKTTAALRQQGVFPIYVAANNYAKSLVDALSKNDLIKGKKVLLVLGNLADSTLEEGLKVSADISRLDVYNTHLEGTENADLAAVLAAKETISVFTSPSAFLAFSSLYDASKTTIVSIGNTTSDFIKTKGFSPLITAATQSYKGICEAIISYYQLKNKCA